MSTCKATVLRRGVWWLGSSSAVCQEPPNLPAGAQEVREGRKELKLVLAEAAHPGWVKLDVESLSASQGDDEFPERSDAVL